MTTTPATFTVLDCSTVHVTPTDMEGLAYVESVSAHVDQFGAWVHVPADGLDDALTAMRADGLSELFTAVLRRASEAGCRYLRLDGDGPTDDTLGASSDW